jgi:hypothetical protein
VSGRDEGSECSSHCLGLLLVVGKIEEVSRAKEFGEHESGCPETV